MHEGIWDQIKSWFSSRTWFLPFLECGTYSFHYSLTSILAFHFKLNCQVCFLLPRIHQNTDAPDGDENMASLVTPLWSTALMLPAPSLPHQQEAATE
jgi:hypothetical protein